MAGRPSASGAWSRSAIAHRLWRCRLVGGVQGPRRISTIRCARCRPSWRSACAAWPCSSPCRSSISARSAPVRSLRGSKAARSRPRSSTGRRWRSISARRPGTACRNRRDGPAEPAQAGGAALKTENRYDVDARCESVDASSESRPAICASSRRISQLTDRASQRRSPTRLCRCKTGHARWCRLDAEPAAAGRPAGYDKAASVAI